MDNDVYDHVTKVIRYHPRYFEHYIRTHKYLMYDDGPLPFVYRHYLAIMAASRNKCNYLVNLHEKEFLLQGGDSKWLGGLEFIPPKLRAIYDINKILAHRPWLLTKEHIERLTKSNNWSLAEVVHAIVLLAHFHSLSSFVFSCGLTQDLESSSLKTQTKLMDNDGLGDDELLLSPAPPSPTIKPSTTPPFIQKLLLDQQRQNSQLIHDAEVRLMINNNNNNNNNNILSNNNNNNNGAIVGQNGSDNVELLMKRMQDLSEKKNSCSEVELSNRFKNVELQAAQLAASAEKIIEVPPTLSHYLDDPTYTYQDFARRGAENIPHTFRIQDYSWDDHGYSLVNRLYNDVGYLLDDKFRVAYNLTYYTIAGRQNVDTSKFRRAIWNYIQCIYGIRHDDYDYGEINQLLDRSLKTFIKTACCFPERITKKDYDSVLIELQDSEKVHVNLMILEAKNQAILLYALREIMRYMI
ncbi:unnamed protein product [Diamesa tonsa]